MEEQLRKKTEELEALQRNFDDFVESSKDLEAEFDKSLSEAEKDLKEKKAKLSSAEEKVKQQAEEIARLRKEVGSAESENSSLKAKLAAADNAKRELENQNEDLSSRLRILESSEEDMKYKLSEAEEDIVFLNNDIQDMKEGRVKVDQEYADNIARLKEELAQAQALQAQHEGQSSNAGFASAMLAEADLTIQNQKQTIVSLEEHVKELESRIAAHLSEDAQLDDLRAQLQAKDTVIAAKEKEVENYRDLLRQRSPAPGTPDPTSAHEAAELDPLTVDTDQEDDSTPAGDPASPKPSANGFDFNEIAKQSLTFTSPSIKLRSAVKINAISSLMLSIQPILDSDDVHLLKAELQKVSERYESIRNSNTRLINKIQAIRGNILVGCRTRPASDQELHAGGKVCVDAYDDVEMLLYDNRCWKSFAFDRVWKADANQADVYADVEPLVLSVLDGFNGCVMAYGQTGSGKTFTMDGSGDEYGVNYRTIQTIFDTLQYRKAQAVAQRRKMDASAHPAAQVIKGTTTKRVNSSSNLTAMNNKVTNDFEFSNPLGRRMTKETKEAKEPETPVDEPATPDALEDDSIFRYKVEISMMEIYNEQVYDLLHDSSGGGQTDGVSLDVRQGADNIVSVPGLKQITVNNMQEVRQAFAKGARNRATASTKLNEDSSRSHLIIQVEVTVETIDDLADLVPSAITINATATERHSAETTITGRMYLVDLAGSERITKSGAVGSTMKEAMYINKSLLALGDVMEALDQKQKHIPYRNSKLTFLLQNALGGSARTMMIVTACPTDLTFEETSFTLQFATRVRNISLGPIQRTNVHSKNLELSIKSLRSELKDVRKKKASMEDMLAELKKEQKKLQEKSTVAIENKLKASEEAKRAADLLVHHLNKQIADATAKCAEEKEAKDQANIELDLCQRNLKKALEQLKEHMIEAERLQAVIRGKDKEIESVRAALLRAYNASMSPNAAAAAASPSKHRVSIGGDESERRSSSASRLSDGVRVAFVLDEPEKKTESHLSAKSAAFAPDGRMSSPPRTAKPALKGTTSTHTTTMAPPAAPSHSKHFFPPNQATPTQPARLTFVTSNTPAPIIRNPSTPTHGSSSVSSTPTSASSRTSFVTTPASAKPKPAAVSSVRKAPSGLLQDPRPTSATRARPTNGQNSVNTSTPSPSLVKKRQAAQAPASSVRTSLSSIAESSVSSITSTNVTAKMPMLSARSEEALRRHQMRMEKRREAQASK